jgi:hypothetical protein
MARVFIFVRRKMDCRIGSGNDAEGTGCNKSRDGVCPPRRAASRARRLDRLDPGFCRLFAGCAHFRILLLGELVKRNVAHPAGLGDDMPFDGFDRIGTNSPPNRQNIGKPILRDRVSLAGRLLQEGDCGRLVLGNSCPIE